MKVKKTISMGLVYFWAICWNVLEVSAHGIGESFEALTKTFLIQFMFGGIEKSVDLYEGVILDEVAGFVSHIIIWSMIFLLCWQFLKKTKMISGNNNLFIAGIMAFGLGHLHVVFFIAYILQKITGIFGEYSGIVSIILCYCMLIGVVYGYTRSEVPTPSKEQNCQ
jgi:hypothetical protein